MKLYTYYEYHNPKKSKTYGARRKKDRRRVTYVVNDSTVGNDEWKTKMSTEHCMSTIRCFSPCYVPRFNIICIFICFN